MHGAAAYRLCLHNWGRRGLQRGPLQFLYAYVIAPGGVVGFAIASRRGGAKKDTLVNIEFSGDFVINIVPESIAQAINQAAGEYPSHVDEFKEAGLTPMESDLVRPPRVAESPIQFECRLMRVMEFGVLPRVHHFVIGEILRVHVQDDLMIDGVIKSDRLKAIGRLGEDFFIAGHRTSSR